MSGLMSSLYVGTTGLKTSQNALNTTAHNLANVDTTGYTRQQVIIQDNAYKTISINGVSTNQVGSGTSIQLVRTVRNEFYDKQYRLEVGRQGFYDIQYSAVSEIETVLGETEGEQFQTSIEDLWTAFSELVNDSTDITTRTTAINTAKTFLERAQTIQKAIDSYQESLNEKITSTVSRINELGQQIVELNAAIRKYEAGGVQNANDLRDARNLALDELASLAKISYKESSDGTVTVDLEGVNFVTSDGYVKMDVETVDESSTLLKPVWPSLDQDVYTNLSGYDSNSNSDVGILKGILVARGDYVANYTDIPKAPSKDDYDTDAEYQAALNQYEKDVEEYNNTIGSSSIMSFQAQFDQLVHGMVTAINDVLCPNETGYIQLEDGSKVQATYLDLDTAPIGMGDGSQVAGTELFSRSGMSRYVTDEDGNPIIYTVTMLDADGNPLLDDDGNEITKNVYLYNEEDPDDMASLYTLSQIEVNKELLENVNLLPLSSNGGTGDYDASVVEKINDLWNMEFSTLDPNSLTTYTFKDYYVALVGDVAAKGNTFDVIAENQETMVNNIDNSRISITGVSSDEELSNLIKYQHAYNASSRYITTVNSMLETLMNSFFS